MGTEQQHHLAREIYSHVTETLSQATYQDLISMFNVKNLDFFALIAKEMQGVTAEDIKEVAPIVAEKLDNSKQKKESEQFNT